MLIRILLVLFLLSPARKHCCLRYRPQRNHVCLCCFPIQLSKNRPRRKGGKSARPLRPCQAECFRALTKAFRLTRTRVLLDFRLGWKDRECRTAGTEDLKCRRRLCQRRRGNDDNRGGGI